MKISASLNNRDARSSPRLLLTLLAAAAVVIFGTLAIYEVTLGLRVVSTEDGRRLEIAQTPRALPFATLDWPARPALADVVRIDGRVSIITFIYTSCNAICSALGSELQQMQATISRTGLQDKLRLLSISFDPRDTPRQLSAYALQQHANPSVWQFAGIASEAQRKAVLDSFGVVVIPAPAGEFIHNAAFHLVDPQGRLASIIDYENPDQALAAAFALYEKSKQ